MSEPKLISPMLDDFVMGEAISNHHGVRCYPAMKNGSDEKYIVKIISVPASQVQLDAFLLTGVYKDEESALTYFKGLADGIVAEAQALQKLSQAEGFLPYLDWQIVQKEGAVGYDVYLLGTYKMPLDRFMRRSTMTQLNAVNLGLDMCASLAVSRKLGYLCVDLKPSNIFVSDENEFRIGDLGLVALDSLKYAALPGKYRSEYTAPELNDPFATINTTVDIYSAGMILYQVYNDGKLPGEDQKEDLEPPAYADYEMAEIILKACDPDPEKRWQDPLTMGQAIVEHMQRNGANDVPLVPQPVEEELSPTEEAEEVPAEPEEKEDTAGDALVSAIAASLEADTIPDELDALISDKEEAAEAAEEAAEEAEDSAGEAPLDPDDPANLSFMEELSSDDTTPNEDLAADISYYEVSVDTSDILSQADDLLAHETPAGVVAPEPIDVPMPAPISREAVTCEEAGDGDAPAEEQENAAGDRAEEAQEATEEVSEADEAQAAPEELSEAEEAETKAAAEASEPSEESDEDATTAEVAAIMAELDEEVDEVAEVAENDGEPQSPEDDGYADEQISSPIKKKRGKKIIAFILILLLLAGIGFGAYWFYNEYYIQTINDLRLAGSEDYLSVIVDSDIDPELLKVSCTDNYGQKQVSAVNKDGIATFDNLTASTLYTVKVEIEGFHQLEGTISGTYATPAQINIVDFTSINGAEEGALILRFTVDGLEVRNWNVTYSAEGEEEKTVAFTGHMVTLTGLTVGKEYTFRLTTDNNLYVVGSHTMKCTVSPMVNAENLVITACSGDSLSAQWNAPEGVSVSGWSVRCYNDAGFDQTITTAETTATFTGLDCSKGYTVEVTADGMTTNSRCFVSEGSVTIQNPQVASTATSMTVTWENIGTAPQGEWLLLYTIDGSARQEVVRTAACSATISPIVPGATYQFSLQTDGGATVFNGSFEGATAEAVPFEGYLVTASNMTFRMCRTPEKADWNRNDVPAEDFTDTYKIGEKVSFAVRMDRKYKTSSNQITTLYVIRDESGAVYSTATTAQSWTSMWKNYNCELNIPNMPEEAGSYTIEVYFNGCYAHQQAFTVTQ